MAHGPIDHVLDEEKHWTIFTNLFGGFEVPLPFVENLFGTGYTFRVTKFMILELIAAVLIFVIFTRVARKAQGGAPPKGAFQNAFEGLLTFIRDDIAHPNLHEDTDKYTPFLWTAFLFILFCNLLGLVPLLGSPTASIYMTLGLALYSLCLFHGAAIAKMGVVHYFQSLWPGVEKQMPFAFGVGWAFGVVISLMIFLIEFAGTFIKSAVLALRLFVNMFAGHMIIASILFLILVVGESQGLTLTWSIATVLSVAGVVALSLLELLVAFLQAYVFTFLTAIFMGLALHPSH